MRGPYSYEPITDDRGTHFRVRDGADNRIATCWDEGNAKFIVRVLNRAAERKSEDRNATLT